MMVRQKPLASVPYDDFVAALIDLAAAGKPLPHGIVPWTAFPQDIAPPIDVSEAMWRAYKWNPPAFAVEAMPDIYGRADPDGMKKPAWAAIAARVRARQLAGRRAMVLDAVDRKHKDATVFRHNGHDWQALAL